MIDDLIQQLNSALPAERRAAIIALGKTRDAAALTALAQVYRNDPEPELRELARKAGVYIRQNTPAPSAPASSAANVYTPSTTGESYTQRRMREMEEQKRAEDEAAHQDAAPTAEPDGRRPVRGREYRVPKDKRDRAKAYIDAALSYNLKGDNAKAMKNLTEGISLDPNLINDPYFNSIATSVTGLDGDAALDMILDRGRRKEFETTAKQVTKQSKIEKHMDVAEKTSWTDVIWEVVLYTLIVSIGPVLNTLVAMQTSLNFFNELSLMAEGAPMPDMVTSVQNSLLLISAATLIPVGFISGIVGVGGLVLQLVLIHFLARSIFGGYGTLRHLVTTLLGFYNRWFPIVFLVSYLSTAAFFVTAGSPIIACFGIVLAVLLLYVLGATSSKIGAAYDFGTLRGCLSLNVSNFLIIAVIGGVMFVLFQVVGQAALESFFQLNPQLLPPTP